MMFDYENLYFAWKFTSAGKHGAANQAKYRYELEERLYSLQERLMDGVYHPDELRIKHIYFPKRRVVQVPSVEDKIVQHAICDGYLYQCITRPLIKETFACLRGRGERAASQTITDQLRRFYRKHNKRPYILKCDIRQYFASIPHERLLQLVDRYVGDSGAKQVVEQFISLTDIGLPLGLQQSQLLANLYLSEMDHYIKEKLHCKYYGRYMDDFYLMAESKEELEVALDWISTYVSNIGLELNPKTNITYNHVDYLGFTYFMTKTGKVVRRLRKDKAKTQRRFLRKLAEQVGSGEVTPEKAGEKYLGWRKHALKGDCRNLVRNMDQYFNQRLRKVGYAFRVVNKNEVKLWQLSQRPRPER